MSQKRSKKEFKQYSINTLEDAMFVLQSLIAATIRHLEIFDKYSDQAVRLYEKYRNTNVIPADEYDPIHDMVLYRQRELLTYLADRQSSSFSYYGVRDLLLKRKFLTKELDKTSSTILKDFLIIRNSTFHNVQSILVANTEVADHKIEEMNQKYGIKASRMVSYNPVVVDRITAYPIMMLESFIEHNELRSRQFSYILDVMKRDYEDLYKQYNKAAIVVGSAIINNSIVSYKFHDQIFNINDATDITGVSLNIQKGKYDGSAESYIKSTSKIGYKA